MTQIIGFAGKKQSGKDTSCNYITMLKVKELGLAKDIRINDKTGKLEVKDILGQTVRGHEWFTFTPEYVNIEALYETVGPFCKTYNLAGSLKSIAISVLGLPEDKVYGTDEDKMTPTHLLWENMPGVITPDHCGFLFQETSGGSNSVDEIVPSINDKDFMKWLEDKENKISLEWNGCVLHHPGPMTIREVLQFVGTEVFRKMYPNVWVDSLMRRIESEKPEVAVICDVRFDNEIMLLREINTEIKNLSHWWDSCSSVVIGLTRDVFKSKDVHASEQIDFSLCDLTIDNDKMDIETQCGAIYEALTKLECKNIPKVTMGE